MDYAIVKTGGKQYRVSVGSVVEVDNLNGEKDKELILDNVLLWVSKEQVKIGKPNLLGVKIKTRVIDNIKGEKIRVAKFKAKARYRRVMGFRPKLTKLKILDIEEAIAKKEVKRRTLKPRKI